MTSDKYEALIKQSQDTVAAISAAEEERSNLKAVADSLEAQALRDLLETLKPVIPLLTEKLEVETIPMWDSKYNAWLFDKKHTQAIPLYNRTHATVGQWSVCPAGWTRDTAGYGRLLPDRVTISISDVQFCRWIITFCRWIITEDGDLQRGFSKESRISGPYEDEDAIAAEVNYRSVLNDQEVRAKYLSASFGGLCHSIWHLLDDLLKSKTKAVAYHNKRIETVKRILEH